MLLMTHKKPSITFHIEGEDITGEDKRNNTSYHERKIRIGKTEIKLGVRLV